MKNQDTDHFSLFVETCEKMRSTTKKKEKIEIISSYITNLDESSLSTAVLFLSGRVFPASYQEECFLQDQILHST